MSSLVILVAIAAAGTYVVLAITDARIPRLATFVVLAGVLVANKSFATIPIGPAYVMDALLGLALAGVILHRATRQRLARAGYPVLAVTALVTLGLTGILRGREWGQDALLDSVIALYAVAALLPIALFPTLDSLAVFLRLLMPFLVIGSLLFLGLGVLGSGSSTVFTDHTAGAAAAAGLTLALLWPGRLTFTRLAAVAILTSVIVLTHARAVWLGAALAIALLLLVGGPERSRVVRALAMLAVIGVATLAALTTAGSPLADELASEAQSFLFKSAEQTVAATGDNPVGNAEWRLTAWSETWANRIAPNLAVGEGFGRPALQGTSLASEAALLEDTRVQIHNGYLTYLLRGGVLGLGLFLLCVLPPFVALCSFARRSRDRSSRLFALGLVGAVSVYLGDIAFAPVLEGPMGGIPFWFLVGTLHAAVLAIRRSEAVVRVAPPTPYRHLRSAPGELSTS
jgi:hypothetical protein